MNRRSKKRYYAKKKRKSYRKKSVRRKRSLTYSRQYPRRKTQRMSIKRKSGVKISRIRQKFRDWLKTPIGEHAVKSAITIAAVFAIFLMFNKTIKEPLKKDYLKEKENLKEDLKKQKIEMKKELEDQKMSLSLLADSKLDKIAADTELLANNQQENLKMLVDATVTRGGSYSVLKGGGVGPVEEIQLKRAFQTAAEKTDKKEKQLEEKIEKKIEEKISDRTRSKNTEVEDGGGWFSFWGR